MMHGLIIIWALVAIWGVVLWRRAPQRVAEALRVAGGNARMLAPRIVLALLGAGFYATLLPEQKIVEWIGGGSGWLGVLVASAIGAVMPGGPIVSFPIAIAIAKAGAGTPQVVAFLTAWSAVGVHRAITWEIPLLGFSFMRLRLAASLALPLIAGGLALAFG